MTRIILSILVSVWVLGCGETHQKEIISTLDAPAAIGPYSQGIQVGNTLYLAGQIGLNPTSGKLVGTGIEAQTHRVMQNLGAVLKAAGYDFEHVAQVQVFLSDLKNYQNMNTVYAKYFTGNPPARAVIEASALPKDALVEIMMVAVK